MKKSRHYYKGPVVIDSGADINVLPLSAIKISLRKSLAPSAVTISGLTGKPITAVGQLKCSIYFTMKSGKRAFINTEFSVFDLDVPVLVGSPTLEHMTVRSYTVSTESVIFHRRLENRDIDQCIPRIGRPNNAFKIAPARKPVKGTSDEKILWLKDHQKVQFPADRSVRRLESVENLLLGFADISSQRNCPQSLFMSSRQNMTHHYQKRKDFSLMEENGVIDKTRVHGSQCTCLTDSTNLLGNVDNSGNAPDPDYSEAIIKMGEPNKSCPLSACASRLNRLRDRLSPEKGDLYTGNITSFIPIYPRLEEESEVVGRRAGARLHSRRCDRGLAVRRSSFSPDSTLFGTFQTKMSARQQGRTQRLGTPDVLETKKADETSPSFTKNPSRKSRDTRKILAAYFYTLSYVIQSEIN